MSEWNFCNPDIDIVAYLIQLLEKMSEENDDEKRRLLMAKGTKAYNEWLEL